MPQLIYTAARSEAKVNEETVDGLQAIDYRVVRNRHDVGAVGTNERVAVYYGLTMVVGRLRVASVNAKLDDLLKSGDSFDISVHLTHGDSERTVRKDGAWVFKESLVFEVCLDSRIDPNSRSTTRKRSVRRAGAAMDGLRISVSSPGVNQILVWGG